MRDIKFRGKRIDNGDWIEGFVFEHLPPPVAIVPEGYVPEKSKWLILINGMSDWNLPRPIMSAEVDSATIGQYTGLKDKNGKEIYEGDILRENKYRFTVVYDRRWANFKLQHDGKAIQYPEWNRGILMEIVGNIHDNPELLGGDT
jgi:hypothetical protein